MLKPDPMRYYRVGPTRITGPEWIEPDLPEPEAAGNDRVDPLEVLAFHHPEELPADFALDLKLHEILERALLTTTATGAMIALASGDKMVCRATSGEKTPSTGSFLNTRSGLSGLCVQTREMQRCDDTLADPRVNADACRVLDVRSIVVLPVLEGTRLWGILEIFSSRSRAFSDADVPELQALGRAVSQAVKEAVEGGSETPVPDTWSAPANPDPEPAETEAHEILRSGLRDPATHRRDYHTGTLTVAVIALAVLLGWMVGRVGWSMAVDRTRTHLPVNSEEAQAVQGPLQTVPSAAEKPADSAKPVSPAPVPPPASIAAAKPKTAAVEPTDGLVVYEQGKVVFRMSPSPNSPPSGGDSDPVQNAATREGDTAGAPVSVSPSATDSYLLERVEPQYPEEARQQHIQGPVVLNALVGTDGAVRELKVVSGDPLLVKAAADAVRQWRFRPHRLKERLVEFETRITVNFELP
jgi:TonB family protein